jgi:prepilin-type N-terminal cleavage/methylation domain-containing protein
MKSHGFTLLELVIALSITSIVGALAFVAMATSAQSAEIADAKAEAMDNVRNVMESMTRELEMASTRDNPGLDPPLEPITVVTNPDNPNFPVELVFQVPADPSGQTYSQPIRYRYFNEDTNGDGTLNSWEDADDDHILDRIIQRVQDINGDGDTDDDGEVRTVGAANNISGLQFQLVDSAGTPDPDGNMLEIAIVSERSFDNRPNNPVRVVLRSRVHLQN